MALATQRLKVLQVTAKMVEASEEELDVDPWRSNGRQKGSKN